MNSYLAALSTTKISNLFSKSQGYHGTWLTQSVEHLTLDLRVVSLRPTLGAEIIFLFFIK